MKTSITNPFLKLFKKTSITNPFLKLFKKWLLILIVFLGLFVEVESSLADISSTQRDALIDFYTDMNGVNWTNITVGEEWKSEGVFKDLNTECDWYGIICDLEKNNITQIDLAENIKSIFKD